MKIDTSEPEKEFENLQAELNSKKTFFNRKVEKIYHQEGKIEEFVELYGTNCKISNFKTYTNGVETECSAILSFDISDDFKILKEPIKEINKVWREYVKDIPIAGIDWEKIGKRLKFTLFL